ncbi:hypothetical protein LguiA_003565 [Lonicera macranthoides]
MWVWYGFDRGCDDFGLFGVRENIFEIGDHMIMFWRRWPEMEVKREDDRREVAGDGGDGGRAREYGDVVIEDGRKEEVAGDGGR